MQMSKLIDALTFQKIICEILTGPVDSALFSDSKYTTLDLPVQIGHQNFGFNGKKKDAIHTHLEIRAKCNHIKSLLEQFKDYPFILALHGINSDVIEYLHKKIIPRLPFRLVFDESSYACLVYHVILWGRIQEVVLPANPREFFSLQILGFSFYIIPPCAEFLKSNEIKWMGNRWLVHGSNTACNLEYEPMSVHMYDADSAFICNICPNIECRLETRKKLTDAGEYDKPSADVIRYHIYEWVDHPIQHPIYHRFEKLFEYFGVLLVVKITEGQMEEIRMDSKLFQILTDKKLLEEVSIQPYFSLNEDISEESGQLKKISIQPCLSLNEDISEESWQLKEAFSEESV